MTSEDDERPDDGVTDDDDALTGAEAPEAATSLSPEMDLGPRGAALWRAVLQAGELDAAGRVLLVEACRIADRLERLNGLLSGEVEEWARIREARFEGDDVVLMIDSAMTEARQQAGTLRLLLGQLGLGKLAAKPETRGGGLDELRARRAERAARPPAAAAAQPPS